MVSFAILGSWSPAGLAGICWDLLARVLMAFRLQARPYSNPSVLASLHGLLGCLARMQTVIVDQTLALLEAYSIFKRIYIYIYIYIQEVWKPIGNYQAPPNRLDETDIFIKYPSISLVKQALLQNQLLFLPLRPSFTLVKSVFSALGPLGHPLWFPLASLGPPRDLHCCSCDPLVLLIVSQWSPCRLHWRPCGALGSSLGVSGCPCGLQ